MLHLIRAQQQQLDTLRAQQAGSSLPDGPTNNSSTAIVDELTPQSEQALNFPSIHPAVAPIPRPTGRLSREPSSANRSPLMRALQSQESHASSFEALPSSPLGAGRRNSSSRRSSVLDESAYYQAETANLQRENQMLRLRIRELEKQLSEKTGSPANTPSTPSNLATSATEMEELSVA